MHHRERIVKGTRIIDLVLGQLRAAGFQGEQAVRLYRSFGDFILALTAVDGNRMRGPAPGGKIQALGYAAGSAASGDSRPTGSAGGRATP